MEESIVWFLCWAPEGRQKGTPRYEVMGVTRYWAFSKESMDRMIANGQVVQTKPGAVPQRKRYLDESEGVPLQDLWMGYSCCARRCTGKR